MDEERLPSPREEAPREVEAEVVGGRERRPPLLERLKARLALAVVLGVLGLALIFAGLFLTLTLVGAVLGIPALLLGLGLLIAMLWVLLGGGSIRVHGFRR